MADRYWVNNGGAGDNSWNDTLNWSATSSGAGGAGVPTSADDVIFDGVDDDDNCTFDVAISVGSFTVLVGYIGTIDANDFDMTFIGDISFAGTFTWTKGTGTITLSGTAAQSIDFNDESVEAIDIDKTAETVTLSGDVNPTALTLTDGTLDIDGNNIDTVGNFTQLAGTKVQNTTGGGLVTVGGAFLITGGDGTELVTNGDCEAASPTISGVSLNEYGAGSILQSTEQAHSSTKSIKFIKDTTTANSDLRFQTSLGAGSYHKTSVWVYLPSGQTVDALRLFYRNNSGSSILLDTITITDTWVELSGVCFDDGIQRVLMVVGTNDTVSAEYWYIDDFSATKVAVWDNVDLDITGTAVAHYTTATDSNAEAGTGTGTEVTATDNCTDGTGNTGWVFAAAGTRPLPQAVFTGCFGSPFNGVF